MKTIRIGRWLGCYTHRSNLYILPHNIFFYIKYKTYKTMWEKDVYVQESTRLCVSVSNLKIIYSF